MTLPERIPAVVKHPAHPAPELGTAEYATAWALSHMPLPYIQGASLVVEPVDLEIMGGAITPGALDDDHRWTPHPLDTIAVLGGCVDDDWEPVYYSLLRRSGAVHYLCLTRHNRREYLAVVKWEQILEAARRNFLERPFAQHRDPPWLSDPAR